MRPACSYILVSSLTGTHSLCSYQGHSPSTTLIAAYLIKEGKTKTEALSLIKNVIPTAKPNQSF
jgi:predicted protein tyrosine phosphatase